MRPVLIAATLLTATALSACAGDSMMSPSGTLEVLAVQPAAASTGISVSTTVTVSFSRAMMTGMESRILLHEGTVTGAEVAGSGTWSTDRRTFTFVPAVPLKSRTTYVLHLAGDMRGIDGMGLDHRNCTARGGSAASGAMMNGYSHGNMMGSGWRAADGTYGMIFTFTTA